LGKNLVCDIGLVKITDKGPWPRVEMGHSSIMGRGDRCIIMGYPHTHPGREPVVQEVQIARDEHSAPTRDEWHHLVWTSDAPDLTGGASGGGVVDLQGRVVGVHLGGNRPPGRGGQTRNARVELFRKHWGFLAAAKPVDVADSDPLAKITAAFSRIAEDLPPIAVEVLADGQPLALGTIVRSDGRILTKASDLGEAVSCRLADGRVLPANVEKVSQEYDLAVLKIDAHGLGEARWSPDESIAPGTLTAALVPGGPPRAGVVSLAARSTPRVTGDLGVRLRDGDRGMEVQIARSDTPFRKGDVVHSIEGRPTPDRDAYYALMKPESGAAIAYAGDPVRVGVRRGRDTLEFRFSLFPVEYYGRTSRRWWGYPSVFVTDFRLTPKHCGGPVIDRNGQVAGIAIACKGIRDPDKGECHVIPAHVARGVAAD
jgi:serine protease Do